MDERTPGYYAVIPASVRYDDGIPANAKLLYGEISALAGKKGYCYAENQYFADLYGMSVETIARLITKLVKAGHIKRVVDKDKAGQIVGRRLYLTVSVADGQEGGGGIDKKINTPLQKNQEGIDEKVKDYNRKNNTSDNIKENKKEKSGENFSETAGRAPKTDFDPLPLFVEWITVTFGDTVSAADKNALYFALARFCENRQAIKKPMKSKGSVTALCNRLLRLTSGLRDPHIAMIELLDLATTNNWQSVYPSKEQSVPWKTNPRPGRVYEEL